MSLVKRIDMLCKERNTTMTAIERECGLGISSIRKWDDHSPSLTKVMAVADALGASVADLIGDQQKKPTPENGDGLDEQDRQLMELMKLLTADQKEFLRAQLLTLTGRDK